MKEKTKVFIYTDGSCLNNPGAGGYCAILECNGHEKVVCGGEAHTTNNRMELIAVITGIGCLTRECDVLVTTDSQYVVNAINKGWLENWKKNGWKKSNGEDVVNQDLWVVLDTILQLHNVEFAWIKGHSGHPQNERCDKIAVSESEKFLLGRQKLKQ